MRVPSGFRLIVAASSSLDSAGIPKRIASASNDVYINEDGSTLIDMFGANGSVWLGHANARVQRALVAQAAQVWNTGAVPSTVRGVAESALERSSPNGYCCLGFYSTGMEAAEFAIRVARAHIGKPGVAGFEAAMHGKSLATSYLGWDNQDAVVLPNVVRLPGIANHAEATVLNELEKTLAVGTTSAVFVEPMQATSGAHMASATFYAQVQRLCRGARALLVFDEILTGCYRTGPHYLFQHLRVSPDIILVGKPLGNGFPVSAVLAQQTIEVTPRMLPGSTFAGNPLAAAVAVEVLQILSEDPPGARVEAIGRCVSDALASSRSAVLRGMGALWVLELASVATARAAARRIYDRGVLVGQAGPFLRLLPSVSITASHLTQACEVIRGVLDHVDQAGAGIIDPADRA